MTQLIVFKGKPGVGKSTIASAFAQKINCPVIHKDDINDIIFAKFGANKESSELSYNIILYFVANLLKTNKFNQIIVDCSLAKKESYQLFQDFTNSQKIILKVIEVYLEDNQKLITRLSQRNNLPDHRIKKPEDIIKQGLSYDNYQVRNVIKIDSAKPLTEIINKIVDHL